VCVRTNKSPRFQWEVGSADSAAIWTGSELVGLSVWVILTKAPPIQSFASHARASSRVLKAGNSRREKLFRFSDNP
jgi:hypothetical protein